MGGAIALQKAHQTRMRIYTFELSGVELLVRILRLTDPPADVQERIRQQTQEYARRGFRTLGESSAMLSRTLTDAFVLRLIGVACKEDGDDWKFLGLLPMFVSTLPLIISLSQWPY
jgi:hypothetical protein